MHLFSVDQCAAEFSRPMLLQLLLFDLLIRFCDFVIVLFLCCCCVVVVLFDVLLLLLCSCHFVIVSYCCMDCSDKLISVCVKFFYKVADRQTEPLLEVLSDLKM